MFTLKVALPSGVGKVDAASAAAIEAYRGEVKRCPAGKRGRVRLKQL